MVPLSVPLKSTELPSTVTVLYDSFFAWQTWPLASLPQTHEAVPACGVFGWQVSPVRSHQAQSKEAAACGRCHPRLQCVPAPPAGSREGGRERGGLPQSKDRREGRLPVLAAVSTVKLSGMLTA